MSHVGQLTRSQKLRDKYASLSVTAVEHEDRLDPSAAQDVWNDIYSVFGASGEGAQTNVRVAIYGYYAVNGTSRRTPHNCDITTSDGVTIASADVLKCIGKENIRKFMRSDVADAYFALKETDILTNDAVYSTKMERERGVPRSYCYVAVDYLRGCPEFTPDEARYAEKAFQLSISRAAVARGGVDIDEEDMQESLKHVQAGGTRASHGQAADDF